jgi:hypothetical protein
VSALTGIWSLIGEPESSCTTQRSKSNGTSSGDDPVCFSRDRQGHLLTPFYAATSSGLISQNCCSTPKPVYEDLSSVKKTLMLTPFSSAVGVSSIWRHMCSINKFGGGRFLQFGNMYCMQTERTASETSERMIILPPIWPAGMIILPVDQKACLLSHVLCRMKKLIWHIIVKVLCMMLNPI